MGTRTWLDEGEGEGEGDGDGVERPSDSALNTEKSEPLRDGGDGVSTPDGRGAGVLDGLDTVMS